MRWFGEPWPSAELRAPICEDDADRMPTPVGSVCLYCEELIDVGDRGVEMGYIGPSDYGVRYAHLECDFRQVMGGPAHLRGGRCEHCGGTGDPDMGMSPREAARVVWRHYSNDIPTSRREEP